MAQPKAAPLFAALPQPEPGLTPQQMIARAAALRPLLYEQQDEADRLGRYTGEVHERMLREGFYRILQPTRFGGYEFEPETFIRVIMELSRGHPGAGWCYTLAASHGYVLGAHWPEEAQADLFGRGGEFRSPFVLNANGRLTPVKGGYTVDGLWSFASGIPVSTHFMANGLIIRDGAAPQMACFILPVERVTILPDWGGEEAMGMQASGSNSVEVKGAFVPAHHVIETTLERLMSEPDPTGTPGAALHRNPIYLAVLQGWFSTEFGAIFTGTARAACDEYERLIRTRKMTLNPALLRMHDPDSQRPLGEALGLADAAEALTLDAVRLYSDLCSRWQCEGRPFTAADSFRVWGLSREANKLACEAVEKLFHAAGASIAKKGSRLQRYFRDVQMYRLHIQSSPRFPTERAMNHLGIPLPKLISD